MHIGRTRFDRCLHIGQTSLYLATEALKGAVSEAKRGSDVSRYSTAVEALQEVASDDPDARLDMNWVEATAKQVKAETDRLEFELKGYKNNLIKESIRASSFPFHISWPGY